MLSRRKKVLLFSSSGGGESVPLSLFTQGTPASEVPYEGSNIVPFQTAANCTVTEDTTDKVDGNASVKIVSSRANFPGIRVYFPTGTGRTYQFIFDYKANSTLATARFLNGFVERLVNVSTPTISAFTVVSVLT
jgi:hypothetical protein